MYSIQYCIHIFRVTSPTHRVVSSKLYCTVLGTKCTTVSPNTTERTHSPTTRNASIFSGFFVIVTSIARSFPERFTPSKISNIFPVEKELRNGRSTRLMFTLVVSLLVDTNTRASTYT